MKSNKGITLTALVIYMTVATIVIGIMAMATSSFVSNMQLVKNQEQYVIEYNKFNMLFIQDVKDNKTAEITSNNTSIIFEDGTRYQYNQSNNSIYRNSIKIAENIQSVAFTSQTYAVNNIDKQIVKVDISIGESYHDSIEYVLKYW